jgi:hypothetical protein
MKYTGQGSEKRSYRVILLLIVGLAAFSSAMKELNQVHELTLQTGQLVAQWTDSLSSEKNEMLVKADTCDSKVLAPPVPDLPPLPPVPDVAVPADVPSAPADIELVVPAPLPQTAPPAPPVPPAKPRRVVRIQREAAVTAKVAEAPEVRVFVSTEGMVDKALKDAFQVDMNQKAFKAKNRRHIWIGPEGRDVILKTLNRSINLRTS